MDSLIKLLECLDFPGHSQLNINDRHDFVRLVSWLEDRKIRELEISQRNSLRTDSPDWESEFNKVLLSFIAKYDIKRKFCVNSTSGRWDVRMTIL